MASTFSFRVEAVLERDEGKFMSRDEMAEQLLEAIESADPGSVDGGPDGTSSYSVVEWTVEEVDEKAEKKAKSK